MFDYPAKLFCGVKASAMDKFGLQEGRLPDDILKKMIFKYKE